MWPSLLAGEAIILPQGVPENIWRTVVFYLSPVPHSPRRLGSVGTRAPPAPLCLQKSFPRAVPRWGPGAGLQAGHDRLVA